jgi:putative sigma-54 modulation protein
MTIKFNTKDANLKDHILENIEKKINLRLAKYFKDEEPTVGVKITERKNIHKVELSLPYYGYQLRCEVSGIDGAVAALDKSLDTIERQMEKCKTKIAKAKRKPTPEMGETPSAPVADDSYKIVRTKNYTMKPMTVQEAILNMELLGHNFFMFQNADTGNNGVVYKRNDGDFGVIESV